MSDRLDMIRARFRVAEDVPTPDLTPPADDAPGEGAGVPNPVEAEGARLPLNDIGNGLRFQLYHGENVIRVPRVGWFVWDGKAWIKDPSDNRDLNPRVRALAHHVAKLMNEECAHLTLDPWVRDALARESAARRRLAELEGSDDPDQGELANVRAEIRKIEAAAKAKRDQKTEHARFAKSTGNSTRLDAMQREAAVLLSRAFEEIDARPLELNVDNGVLAFRTVEPGEGASAVAEVHLREHRREDLMTKLVPVEFDPDATCPRFDAFLERIQPDRRMREFLQRWFGLNLTSITGDQKLAFFYGQGANGKSVITDLMARIMGNYAATAKIESLTGTNRRGGSDATPDLIPLMGARMVRASEPEQGTRLQEGVIKELTGGESILVRALHSDFVEVKPQFKLTISGNHKPQIRGTDDGIWRRLMLVPFDIMIPEAERDRDLGRKLWEERSGILNWMVAGLIDYLEGGLQVPEVVTAATQGYREDSDPIGVFLTECCEVTGNDADFTRSGTLVEAFNFWLEDRGEGTWQPRTITTRLKTRASRFRHPTTGSTFTAVKKSVQGYAGIRLDPEFERRWTDAAASRSSSRVSPHPTHLL